MKPKIVKKTESKSRKDKSQSKRMKTFSSSQFSLCQQKNKIQNSSATDLNILKQQTISNRRAQNNSALSQYNNVKSNTTKLPVKKKKKTVPKAKLKIKKMQEEQFQKIKYKQSNSQSQIVFSNDETKRQSMMQMQIRNDRYLQANNNNNSYHSNLILRVNIKKQYVRKVQAATKIQKIFRGYMTRKILMKYIDDEEEKLKKRTLNSNSNLSSFRENQTHRTFVDKDGQNLMNRLFSNRGIVDINFNHTIRPRAEQFESQSLNEVECISKRNNLDEENNSSSRQQHKQYREQSYQNQQSGYRDNDQQQSQNEESQSEQDQDQDSKNLYRRQNPIYSQQQISQYLESSQEQQQQQLDLYEPEIIFETNEEYIESRKSSLQNKNQTINKLSSKGMNQLPIVLQEDKIRKQLLEQGQVKISKKKTFDQTQKGRDQETPNRLAYQQQSIEDSKVSQNQNTIKKNNFKLQQKNQGNNVFETIIVNFNSDNKIAKQNQKQNQSIQQNKPDNKLIFSARSSQSQKQKRQQKSEPFSPRRQIKYLDQQGNSSSSCNSSRANKSKASVQIKQIVKLKELQYQKWDEVIRMVSQQIKKSNESNEQMVNFMKNIMEFSQKNKQLLGSTRSVNSQSESLNTPTSTGAYYSIQVKDGAKSLGLPVSGQKIQVIKSQEDNSINCKFFKKKKPLKIDILDSNFLQQQRQTLNGSQKSESNLKKNKFQFEQQKQFVRSVRRKQQNKELESPNFVDNENFQVPYIKKNQKNQLQQSLQNSKKLKKFLSSNIQVQDEAVYDILKLRQQLLQKRQSQQLVNLNNLLSGNKLSQQQFLQKLSHLTRKFMQQKQAIDKAKLDISKGYQAANDLVKQYFFDVRRMGIKLAVSKSQDNLKYKISPSSYFSSDIKIDQMTPKSTPKSGKRISVKEIFAQHEICEQNSKEKSSNINHSNIQSSEDSSIDFTQQQLRRFRKAANYDLQFNDMNRNMTTISDQFIKQQKRTFQQSMQLNAFSESPEALKFNRSIQPYRQTYQLEQSKVPSTRTPPHIQAIIQNQVNLLMWQLASQLILRPEISEKIIQRPSIIKPSQIKIQQKIQFLGILQQNLPQNSTLHRKLNQNISPLPSQILKCMRLDFSDEPDEEAEDNYEEVNRYQFVISQEACAKSVMLFKNNLDLSQQHKEIQEIKIYNQTNKVFEEMMKNSILNQKISKFIAQREKIIRNKKQHTRQLRWEVMNIQLHCIFDSWNEQIIQICSNRPGFSGIGLNQLTLSMVNHNKPVPEHKSRSLVMQAKQKVIQILTDDTDVNAKFLRQNFHEMCQTDSAWIFYADQALSYALQLVYLVEEDIYSQLAKQIRKISIKNSLYI